MPFDGSSLTAPAKPSLWSRLAFWRKPPAAFQFMPATDPVDRTLQVLTLGRALIEDRKNWTQQRYETRDGRRCAVGALRAVSRSMNMSTVHIGAFVALTSVAHSRGYGDIETMNDNSSHRQVLSAFDEAIARARAAT